MANSETTKPLYPRITEWANLATSGEFTFCFSCEETQAICPDCGVEMCVFCEDMCPACRESMF